MWVSASSFQKLVISASKFAAKLEPGTDADANLAAI